jgi:hypothetical protein
VPQIYRSLIVAIVLAAIPIWPAIGRARFAAYAEVRDILTTLADVLPPALTDGRAATEQTWSAWIANHDREVRARLERGDEDTIVNWIRFGTSFTDKPRTTLGSSGGRDDPSVPAVDIGRLIGERIHDLTAALASPGEDERRVFAKKLFERKGFRLDSAEGRARLEQHLAAEVARVAGEQAAYAKELDTVRQLPDASEQFAQRSRIYRERGLSLDTSLAPGFALEQTLRRMLADGVLDRGAIRRAAVIGPGLDFTDKAAGLDIYPQQTLQPFALEDTLLRLGLADPAAGAGIVTFDISPRVNDHLTRARARARTGNSYLLRLPLDLGVRWDPGLVDYWKRVGDRIGVERRQTKPPSLGGHLEVRTVSVRPAVALRIAPEDLNIVAQRYEGRELDLIVATNVFVYYDTLDQSLAMAAVESMLRPGGFLLSNNALLELPASRMRSAGYLTVQYSDRPDDGDHIVWYRRMP